MSYFSAGSDLLRYAIYISSAAEPTWDRTTGWSGTPVKEGSQAAGPVGVNDWTDLVCDLDPSTDYKIAFVWDDGEDSSAVAYSDLWTTLAATGSVTVELQPGQSTANGQTLVPAVGATATVEAGQSVANGQVLVPQAGASVPVSVDAQAGQAVANGQTLTVTHGHSINLQPGQAQANGQTLVPRVSVTVTIQAGQAEALGKQIAVVAGHVITLQPGQSIANGQNLIPFTALVLGIVRDPGSRSATVRLDNIRG